MSEPTKLTPRNVVRHTVVRIMLGGTTATHVLPEAMTLDGLAASVTIESVGFVAADQDMP